MKIYYILALIPLISINALVGMDVSALYDRTMEAIENEPVPAGMVILVSKEGKEFQLPQAIAQQSKTLQGMIEDIGAGRKIPLANISTQTLEEIVALLQSLNKHQNLQDKALLAALEKDVSITDPFALLAAANYLDIQPIIELAARAIARQEVNKKKGLLNIKEGPLSKEINDKLFALFGNNKQDLVPFIARYFFLLSGKHLTGVPENSYGFSIQDYLDYGHKIQHLLIHTNNLRLNSLQGLQNLPNIRANKSIIIGNASIIPLFSVDVPVNIFTNLNNIEVLIIYNNKLQNIPINALQRLNNLTFLDLSHNQIKEIPDSIDLLTKLEVLQLNENAITVIPKNITKLLNLQRIELHSNQITHIDRDIIDALAQMRTLLTIDLRKNPLDQETKDVLRNTLGNRVLLD